MAELVYARDKLCDSIEHGNLILTSKGIEGITASSNGHFLAISCSLRCQASMFPSRYSRTTTSRNRAFDPALPPAVDSVTHIQIGAK